MQASNGYISAKTRYLKHIVLSEGAKAQKLDKRIFEYAMQLNNAKASECIMIDDSYEADIVGARNAGIDQVWYNPKKGIFKTFQLNGYNRFIFESHSHIIDIKKAYSLLSRLF